ncbi:FAD binding domain-containing protein [Actinomadura sp. 9N215]|uniref:FAD binding domain-containing protein n=1 Tax=Actinomadura sp. 9N215 TaxID=3375150 RepID=UPI0037A228AA
MKPAGFAYHAPRSLGECLDLLVRHGEDAKLLAGGQSLVPLMNLRLARPEVVIDLGRVEGLSGLRLREGFLEIGPMIRHADIAGSELVAANCPLLAAASAVIGYPAIRNRGTIGGSLAHADPAAELPCVAVTLDAEFEVTGPRGARTIPAAGFFVSHFVSALEADEVLTAVRVPVQTQRTWGFEEFARKSGDFALSAVAVDLATTAGAVPRTRIGVAGLGPRPLRATATEYTLSSTPPADVVAADVGRAVRDEIGGQTSDAERRHLVETLVARAWTAALDRMGDRRE